MNLRPLGDRVLIKPDAPITETESGLQLVEHYKPEQTGTVIATGVARHPNADEAEAWAKQLEDDASETEYDRNYLFEAAKFVRSLVALEPVAKPGDRVVFSWMVGQELWVNDGEERYLLMKESDLLAVVEH